MELYIVNISILRRFPPGEWVSLGQTVEAALKMPTSSPAPDVICSAFF